MEEKIKLIDFRAGFRQQHPHIHHEQTDEQILKFLKEREKHNMSHQMDLFADYLLANGLADVEE